MIATSWWPETERLERECTNSCSFMEGRNVYNQAGCSRLSLRVAARKDRGRFNQAVPHSTRSEPCLHSRRWRIPCFGRSRRPAGCVQVHGEGQSCAVITNGTAVLGLGDNRCSGQQTGHGKAKRSCSKDSPTIDVFDLELDTHNSDEGSSRSVNSSSRLSARSISKTSRRRNVFISRRR